MISNSKLIDYYNRAVSEYNHPEPDKAVFGRAQLSDRNSEHSKGGRIGLFSISEKRAKEAGWEDLKNPEQNFRAAMDLDTNSFDAGDLAEMYISTAGITGGQKKKDSFTMELDEDFGLISSKISYEAGVPVGINDSDPEVQTDLLEGADTSEEISEETKRQSAQMQKSVVQSSVENSSLDRDVENAVALLKEYINKAV